MTFLAKSPYIRDLYGVCINLVEVTWKGKIKAQLPDPNDYSAFMGDFSTATGVVTFLMMIVSRFLFKRFGCVGRRRHDHPLRAGTLRQLSAPITAVMGLHPPDGCGTPMLMPYAYL